MIAIGQALCQKPAFDWFGYFEGRHRALIWHWSSVRKGKYDGKEKNKSGRRRRKHFRGRGADFPETVRL